MVVGAARILDELIRGHFRPTRHAFQRMNERHVTRADIMAAAYSAGSAELQAKGTYEVKGLDLDGDPLTVVCAWDGETLIVTVF